MTVALLAALVNPLLFGAVALASAFLLAGSVSSLGGVAAAVTIVLLFPLTAACAVTALRRWIFLDSGRSLVGLLAASVAMYFQLHSEAFLHFLGRSIGRSDGGVGAVVLSLFVESALLIGLPIVAVMMMVLLLELPLRLMARTVGAYEVGNAACLVRFVIAFWVLLAGAAVISDEVSMRCSALFGQLGS